MRYVSFRTGDHASWGLIEGDRITELMRAGMPTLRSALALGPLPTGGGTATHALSDVMLLPPISDPAKIFCVGHNYEEHRLETNGPRVGHPAIFTRFADTLIGDGAGILRPSESEKLDYEGELAVVIGTGGRRIAEADAMRHVAGFACANDASVRDWQRHTAQFTPGKNWPTTCPFGPWLVTPDAIPDLDEATLTTRLNGEIMQQAKIAQQIFPIAVVIAYLSTFTPLSPGDVILTGTPGGVGARREPPVWMKPGDQIEVEIEGVGTLRNAIVSD